MSAAVLPPTPSAIPMNHHGTDYLTSQMMRDTSARPPTSYSEFEPHIPGAWNGSKPTTPGPIANDVNAVVESMKNTDISGTARNVLPESFLQYIPGTGPRKEMLEAQPNPSSQIDAATTPADANATAGPTTTEIIVEKVTAILPAAVVAQLPIAAKSPEPQQTYQSNEEASAPSTQSPPAQQNVPTIIGSTISPDADVQEAAKSASPNEFKAEVPISPIGASLTSSEQANEEHPIITTTNVMPAAPVAEVPKHNDQATTHENTKEKISHKAKDAAVATGIAGAIHKVRSNDHKHDETASSSAYPDSTYHPTPVENEASHESAPIERKRSIKDKLHPKPRERVGVVPINTESRNKLRKETPLAQQIHSAQPPYSASTQQSERQSTIDALSTRAVGGNTSVSSLSDSIDSSPSLTAHASLGQKYLEVDTNATKDVAAGNALAAVPDHTKFSEEFSPVHVTTKRDNITPPSGNDHHDFGAAPSSPTSSAPSSRFASIRKLTKRSKPAGVHATNVDPAIEQEGSPSKRARSASRHEHKLSGSTSHPHGGNGGHGVVDDGSVARRYVSMDEDRSHNVATHTAQQPDWTRQATGSNSIDLNQTNSHSSNDNNKFAPNGTPEKVKFKDRFKGEVKVLKGKVTGDEELVEEGMRMKEGLKGGAEF